MKDFEFFKQTIASQFFGHPVVTSNPYTAWFSRGEAEEADVAELLEQFSVFSNHFLVLQVKRMVNAGTPEGERCARDILMNECGVGLDARTGSAEGKTFAAANAHINWLREVGSALGLDPRRLGRWDLGSPATHGFLDGLDKTYGSRDGSTGAGASFAIESWAAFGIGHGPAKEKGNFWRQLLDGLEGFNARRKEAGAPPLPLGFFRYHFQLESGHGAGVWKELSETFGTPGFDAPKFLTGGRRALEAINAFWLGLDEGRRRRQAPEERCLAGINVGQWAV